MAVDIKKMTRKELEKLKTDIDKQIEKLAEQDRISALEAAEKAAQQHGYSLSQLTGGGSSRGRKSKAAGKVNPPKYRNPDDPTQTWTGKGRRPEWIKAAQEKGVDIESMAI